MDEMPGAQGVPEDVDMSLPSSQATGQDGAVGRGAGAAAAVRALGPAQGSKRVRAGHAQG